MPRAILVSDWLLLKKSSPLKLLGQMEPNLPGSIYVRSSMKFLRFVSFGQQIWLPRAILVSDWLMLNKSSIRNKNCSWQQYLLAKRNETKKLYRGPYIDASCQVWLNLAKQFQRRTAWPNGAKLARKHLCKVLYEISSFRFVWPTNMAAKSNSCF
jgi:hypothetical protein